MPNSPDRHVARLRAGIEAGRSLSQQEAELDERIKAIPTALQEVPLPQIQDRRHNLRDAVTSHVEYLLESIQHYGLIEPIVVDQTLRLLAGLNRLVALRQLYTEDPDTFERLFPHTQIPVRIMAFIADEDPQLAMAIEIAENAQRRNYTPAEIDRHAQRLIKSGYTVTNGRPKKGEKPIGPALSAVIGCSTRTMRRHLKAIRDNRKTVTAVTIPESERQRAIVARLRKSLAIGIKHIDGFGSANSSLVEALKAADEKLRDFAVSIPEPKSEASLLDEPPQSG